MLPNQDNKKYYYAVSKKGYLQILKDSRIYYVSEGKVINDKKHSKFVMFKLKDKSIINMINTNRHIILREVFKILVEDNINKLLKRHYDL